MFSRMSFENVPPVVVFLVSTTGVAAVTVISSDNWPTSSCWLISALKPVSMTTFCREAFLKLASSNDTVYVPIGTSGN